MVLDNLLHQALLKVVVPPGTNPPVGLLLTFTGRDLSRTFRRSRVMFSLTKSGLAGSLKLVAPPDTNPLVRQRLVLPQVGREGLVDALPNSAGTSFQHLETP